MKTLLSYLVIALVTASATFFTTKYIYLDQADSDTNLYTIIQETPTKEITHSNRSQNADLHTLYKSSHNLPEHDIYCIPDRKFYCSNQGCEEVEAGVFNLINLSESTEISRCDKNPCDTYNATTKKSGDFKIFSDGNSLQIKYGSDLKYVETVSLGTDTYLSFGQCFNKQS